jgi:cytochrome d ubiquinol oxidase subunit II
MADLWYALVAALLTAYVVLDGFDLGAGALHRVVARTDDERRAVLAAIGPYWDGNEVFLLAAGGTLFAAFSRALAVALAGLYLAVFLVLWALLLRGVSIEFRSHLRDGLWRTAWDVVFQASSAALALLLGVALGTVLRGYPLEPDGWFALELFSTASPRAARGVIDGYTLAVGLFSVAALVAHGGRFLAWKTDGPVAARALRAAERGQVATLPLWVLTTALTARFAPGVMAGFAARPAAWLALALAAAGFVAQGLLGRRGRHRAAFLASVAFLVGLMALAAVSAWPHLVRDVAGARSLTVATARNPDAALAAGLRWWFFAAVLVGGYFVNLFRLHARRAEG